MMEKNMINDIQLDLTKLLGFKIVAKELGSQTQQVVLGAKLGEKAGSKYPRSSRLVAKIGGKIGTKNPNPLPPDIRA